MFSIKLQLKIFKDKRPSTLTPHTKVIKINNAFNLLTYSPYSNRKLKNHIHAWYLNLINNHI